MSGKSKLQQLAKTAISALLISGSVNMASADDDKYTDIFFSEVQHLYFLNMEVDAETGRPLWRALDERQSDQLIGRLPEVFPKLRFQFLENQGLVK